MQSCRDAPYRVAKVIRVSGMPYVAKTPSGRQRYAYLACRWNGQGFELLSIHGSAGTARRACERDAATATPPRPDTITAPQIPASAPRRIPERDRWGEGFR